MFKCLAPIHINLPPPKGRSFFYPHLHGGHHWVATRSHKRSWNQGESNEKRRWRFSENHAGESVGRKSAVYFELFSKRTIWGCVWGIVFEEQLVFFEPWALELTALGWHLALVRLLWYHYRRWWKSLLRRQLFCCEVPSRFPRQAEAGLWGRELSAMSSLGDKI